MEIASADKFDGLRMTKQRRVVYDVVTQLAEIHPTASDVFAVAKERMAAISLATVYNCLETLTQAGAVIQVNIDREASRYCPNLQPHAHFFCDQCGSVSDVHPQSGVKFADTWVLPEGAAIREAHVTMRGACGECCPDQPASSGPES
jgi:Fur family peroxide stress response transcriptional regulator